MAGHIATASKIHWCTPPELIALIKEFTGGKIYLDPCHNKWSTVGAEKTIELPTNSLEVDWDARNVFLNPAFGTSYIVNGECLSVKEFKELVDKEPKCAEMAFKQTLGVWIKKCCDTWDQWVKRSKFLRQVNDRELFLLIPGDESTKHFHDLIYKKAHAIVRFRGRVAYVDPFDGAAASSPPMGSVLVYYGKRAETFKEHFEKAGHHVEILNP